MKTYEDRKTVIDSMKCIAIYLVVLGHLVNPQSKLFIAINACHMPIFFLIAGYFSYHTLALKPTSRIFLSKVQRLLIPYIVWSVIAVVANVGLLLLKERRATGTEIFSYLYNALVNAKSVWFFITLFFVFCIMLLVKLTNNLNRPWIFLVLLLLILFLPNELFMFSKLKNYFPFFMVGFYSYQHKEKLIYIENKFRILLGILSITFLPLLLFLSDTIEFINYAEFTYSSYSVNKAITIYLFYFVMGLLSFGLVYYVSQIINHIGKVKYFFADVGRFSMDIYPIHMMLVKFIVIVPAIMKTNCGVLNYVYYPLYSIFITWFCWILSKKILHKIKLYKCFMIGEISIRDCLGRH